MVMVCFSPRYGSNLLQCYVLKVKQDDIMHKFKFSPLGINLETKNYCHYQNNQWLERMLPNFGSRHRVKQGFIIFYCMHTSKQAPEVAKIDSNWCQFVSTPYFVAFEKWSFLFDCT